jgi:hypothetical protein
MTHPVHQLAKRRASRRSQRVPGVAQVVEMGARHPGPGQGRHPEPAPEVAMVKLRTGRAGEHQRIVRRSGEDFEVSGQLGPDCGRDHYKITGGELRASDETTAFRRAAETDIAQLADRAYAIRIIDALHDEHPPAISQHDGVRLL